MARHLVHEPSHSMHIQTRNRYMLNDKNNSLNAKSSKRFWSWLFNDNNLYSHLSDGQKNELDKFRVTVFILLHFACLSVLFTGVSWFALLLAVSLYFARMFFITAFYHRFFSHRSYKTSRPVQFLMAVAGCTTGQRGPLWWASHHREHHITSDTENDPHSPKNGLLNSHCLWFLRKGNFNSDDKRIKDLTKYKELLILEKIDWIPFLLLFIACYFLGDYLAVHYPALNTNGFQTLVWGGFISTTVLYHATYLINSLAHLYGKRRFETKDDSRNNIWLALLTLGEGWHNNHHRYPASTRQGFYPGEIDISYLLLKCFAAVGLVKDFNFVPAHILEEGKRS